MSVRVLVATLTEDWKSDQIYSSPISNGIEQIQLKASYQAYFRFYFGLCALLNLARVWLTESTCWSTLYKMVKCRGFLKSVRSFDHQLYSWRYKNIHFSIKSRLIVLLKKSHPNRSIETSINRSRPTFWNWREIEYFSPFKKYFN